MFVGVFFKSYQDQDVTYFDHTTQLSMLLYLRRARKDTYFDSVPALRHTILKLGHYDGCENHARLPMFQPEELGRRCFLVAYITGRIESLLVYSHSSPCDSLGRVIESTLVSSISNHVLKGM